MLKCLSTGKKYWCTTSYLDPRADVHRNKPTSNLAHWANPASILTSTHQKDNVQTLVSSLC